jgi:hypothetical protein
MKKYFTLGLVIFISLFIMSSNVFARVIPNFGKLNKIPLVPVPQLKIISPINNSVSGINNIILEFTQTDAVSCSYDLGASSIPLSSCNQSIVLNNLTNGSYVLTVHGTNNSGIGQAVTHFSVNTQTPFRQVDLNITSPADDSIVMANNNNKIHLNFTQTNATYCWYNLGGLKDKNGDDTFPLPGCSGRELTLPPIASGDYYVLNLYGINETVVYPSHYGVASVIFKVK